METTRTQGGSDSFRDGGVSSAKVPELEIFPNANVRSWPGVNTDMDFHDSKLDEVLGMLTSASARSGFRTKRIKR